MKSFLIIILVALVLISGCAKTVYVCYDGTEENDAKKCPIVPIAKISQDDAIDAMENYGNAISDAKQEYYTRVNVYQQNATWYSTAMFTNSETGTIKQLLFSIDGITAEVKCVTGCDYLGKK